MYSRAYLDLTEAPWKRKKNENIFSADLEKVPPFVLLILQFNICFEPSNCYVQQNLFSDVKNLSFSVISYNKIERDFHCREIVKYFNIWSLQPSPLVCTCCVQQNLFLKYSFSLSVIFTSTRIEWILNLLWAFQLLCEKKQQFYF